MGLPVLEKFCHVFDLWTGCIVMGIVNSLLTFLMAVALIWLAVDLKAEAQARREDVESAMPSVVYTIVVLMVVLLFIKIASDLVFAYAMIKEKFGIIKKYCIFWIIFLVLFTIGSLKSLFHIDATYAVVQILYLVENLYYCTIIRSYFKSINEEGVF